MFFQLPNTALKVDLVRLREFLVEQIDAQAVTDSCQLSDIVANLLDGVDLFSQKL